MALEFSQWQEVQGMPHFKFGMGPHEVLRIVKRDDPFWSLISLELLSVDYGWRVIYSVQTVESYGFFARQRRLISDEAAVRQLKNYAELLYKQAD